MARPTLRPRWVSIEDAASHCSVSRATMYRHIDKGNVVASRFGTRRLVDLDSVDELLQRNRDQPTTPTRRAPYTGQETVETGDASDFFCGPTVRHGETR